MSNDWRNELVTKGAAIDAQEAYMADHPLDGYEDELVLIDILRNLTPAQPQRMKGRWIDCSSSDHYKCSVCGCRTGFWLEDNDTLTEWLSDFCPSCGADMRGEQDG